MTLADSGMPDVHGDNCYKLAPLYVALLTPMWAYLENPWQRENRLFRLIALNCLLSK
jgi:hypothetical protein